MTYRSGRYFPVIDYILVRRSMMGKVKNGKIIPGELIAAQHILLVADLNIQKQKEKGKT